MRCDGLMGLMASMGYMCSDWTRPGREALMRDVCNKALVLHQDDLSMLEEALDGIDGGRLVAYMVYKEAVASARVFVTGVRRDCIPEVCASLWGAIRDYVDMLLWCVTTAVESAGRRDAVAQQELEGAGARLSVCWDGILLRYGEAMNSIRNEIKS